MTRRPPDPYSFIVIKGTSFSTLNTLLLQMLVQVFQGVFVIIGTYGSTHFRNTHTYFMAWNIAMALVGAVRIRKVPSSQIWTRFMGYCLCIAFSANYPMVLSMSSGNIGGFTKKNTTNAMISELIIVPVSCTDRGRVSSLIAPETSSARNCFWLTRRPAIHPAFSRSSSVVAQRWYYALFYACSWYKRIGGVTKRLASRASPLTRSGTLISQT